jgi:Ca2+-binding RTX toxin-like protein
MRVDWCSHEALHYSRVLLRNSTLAFTTIPGASGAPTTYTGTSGVDVIDIQNVASAVSLNGDAGNDLITYQSFTNLVTNYSLRGGQGNDSINPSAAGTVLGVGSFINGNLGDDLIGATTPVIASGASVLGGQGNDTIRMGSTTNSFLAGNQGNDIISATAVSSSSIWGGQGRDTITTTGNLTSASIQGNLGVDSINIDPATVTTSNISAGDGDDFVTTAALTAWTSSTIFGGEGADTINASAITSTSVGILVYGDAGNDTITGGSGNDTIFGGAGADRIAGGIGGDQMTGGAGVNTYVYGAGAVALTGTGVASTTVAVGSSGQVDIILDFKAGDIINLATAADIAVANGTVLAGTTYATANANEVTLVSGSYNTTTRIFTAGARSASNDDYLFQYNGTASATTVNNVVFLDTASTLTSFTSATEVLTFA